MYEQQAHESEQRQGWPLVQDRPWIQPLPEVPRAPRVPQLVVQTEPQAQWKSVWARIQGQLAVLQLRQKSCGQFCGPLNQSAPEVLQRRWLRQPE